MITLNILSFHDQHTKIVILAGCITLLMTVVLLLCGIHFSFWNYDYNYV